jgi:hypothetical protein
MNYMKTTVSFALALLLVLACETALAQVDAPDGANGASRDASEDAPQPVVPKGVARADIPDFPAGTERRRLVASLKDLSQECGGESYTRLADKLDTKLGGRGRVPIKALLNLVLTENALSPESTELLILSLGRYANGHAALATVARLSAQIATRLYEAQLDTEGRSEAAPSAVIASIQRDLLAAVIESAKLARSASTRAVVASLAKSPVADVAVLASATLESW